MTACAVYHGSIALIFYHNKKLAPANFGTNESTTAPPAVNEEVTTTVMVYILILLVFVFAKFNFDK